MSPNERTEALQRLGYTTREAEFLVLAALHSGYFLRRQFLDFAGVDTGKAVAKLEAKLVENKHASVATYPFGVQVYHLCSHPLYRAIGEGENRHRRPRPPLAIKAKLMGLDFVLERSERHFFATETERTSFFLDRCRFDESLLPGKNYRAKRGGPASRRFFIEKYPLFVRPDPTSPNGLVSFSYIDEGVISTAGFGGFLKRYSRLFAALQRFSLSYVAAAPTHFSSVERTFSRFAERLENPHGPRLDPALAEYFQLRRLLEQRRYEALSTTDLNRLGALRQQFDTQRIERRYAAWIKRGAPAPRKPNPIEAAFETVLLPHNYDIFASDSRVSGSPAGQPRGETFFPTGFHPKGV